jgi:iron(III) transport system ATP-binding protein
VERLLGLAGVHELAARRPSALSGGQQQRVALARALAARPDVLLLDEPFANLDPPLRAELGPAVRQLVSVEEVATVLVTHDRADALALADRVVVLVPGPTGGRVAQIAAPDVLFHEPSCEAVARLIGAGWVLPGEPAAGHVRTVLGDVPCTDCAAGPARLWVRPDQARFERHEGGPARCVACRFVGPGWEIRFALGELEGIATSPGRVPVGAAGGVVVRGAWPLQDG